MRLASLLAGIALAASGTAAMAHPGAEILTTGSKSAPSAMTEGVSFEEVNGVHLFRGNAAVQGGELLGGEPVSHQGDCRHVEIEIQARPWRSFRRLRTQGFYSGIAYPTRQYTQGFFSGRR